MADSTMGLVAAALLLLAAAFQALLAGGAPWAAAAYGGRAAPPDGRLATPYRFASAGTAVFLVGVGWLVLAATGLVVTDHVEVLTGRALWLLVALFALNTVANAAGRHPVERWGAGGVTALLTVLLALLARP